MDRRPVTLVVREDDLVRPRLTVLFRLLLALPHLVWLTLWSIAAWTVAFAAWLAVVIEAEVPSILHDFLAKFVRYSTHVNAYVFLGARSYPGFRGRPGYEVDVEIAPPARQSRWSGGLRLLLAVPAVVLAAFLTGGLGPGAVAFGFGLVGTTAFLGWFAALVSGRLPRGLRDLAVYGIGYGAQVGAYVFLVTDRYPDSRPARRAAARVAAAPRARGGAGRTAPLAGDDVLPSAPRPPALRLARPLVGCRARRRESQAGLRRWRPAAYRCRCTAFSLPTSATAPTCSPS